MKRGVLISLALASILGMAQAGEYKMGGGFGGMTSIQNHAEEAGENLSSSSSSIAASASSSASTQTSGGIEAQASSSSIEPQPVSSSSAPTTIEPIELNPQEGGMETGSASSSMMEPPMQEARSSAMSQASSAHSEAMEHMQEARSSAMSQASSAHSEAMEHMQEARSSAMSQASSAHSEAMEHMQEARSSAMSQASSAHSEAMEHMQEARSSAMSQASSAHSEAREHMQEAGENNSSMPMMGHGEHRGLLALIENGTIPSDLPPQIHNTLKEVKKAVKFYKHPELFEDLNITDVANLDPQTLQEIQERVQRAKEEHIERVEQKLLGNRPKAELPIAGEFVRIGAGQYDWVFVTESGHVYKLAGVNSDGKFKYEPLSGVQGIIERDGKVIFEPQTQNLPVTLPQTPVAGYPFAKYNDPQEDGFDWIVVTKSGRVYKFEGFDEDSKSFFYTPVDGLKAQPKGDAVEILPGS